MPESSAARVPAPDSDVLDASATSSARHLLPSLDYDDGSSRRSRQALESTRPGRRARMRRVSWFAFALGLVLGGLVGAVSQLAPFGGDPAAAPQRATRAP